MHTLHPPNHLIIVCGHAIWTGGPKNGWDESEWLIESYKKGETPTFIEHIRAGVKALAEDNRAVLVFSGAPTRKETPLSEAASYHNLAKANSYFGFLPPLPPPPSSSPPTTTAASTRILLEERALDSYYNILFSLVLFWQTHTVWPESLTIVSHGFKRTRLVDGHCSAIGLHPLHERVRFVGINPPGAEAALGGQGQGQGQDDAELGEKTHVMKGVQLAMGQWEGDPHGVSEELAGKRRARNCWGVHQLLFEDDEGRLRSGLVTRILKDGSEVLVHDAPRPWGRVSEWNMSQCN